MADAKLTFSVEDWKAADEAFSRLSESAKGTRDSLRETGESGIWLVDVLKDLGNSFVGRVAEGVLLRDAVREVLGGIKDVAEALPSMIEHLVDSGNHLFEMSLKTGASVEGLSALRYVASQTGIDFDAFGTSLYKMELALGSSGAKADELQKHLDVLGLNLQTLKNEKPDQAFIDIMAALEAMPNRADQASAGVAIFGKGFKEMAGLTQESITDLMNEARSLGLVMSTETAAAAHAAEVGFQALHLQVEAVGYKISGAFLPAIIGIEQDLGQGLNEAVKTLNSSLSAMGGESGWLSIVARAMGTGDTAIAAQMQLYEKLKGSLLGVASGASEVLIPAIAYTMVGFNASEVIIEDVVQVVNYLALGYQKAALSYEQFRRLFGDKNFWDLEIAGTQGVIDGLNKEIQARADSISKDKQAETDWMNWSVSAQSAVQTAIHAVDNAHHDAAKTIEDFSARSKAAYGGVGEAVEGGKQKVDKFAAALADLDSAGTSWQTTLLGIDGETVSAVEYYLAAGVSANTLKEVYGLTEVQVRALEAAHKSYGAMLKEVQKIEDAKGANSMAWVSQLSEAERKETQRQFQNTSTSVAQTSLLWRQHYDFIESRSMTTEQQQKRAVQLWFDDEVAKLRTDDLNWQKHYDALVLTANDKMQKVTESHDLTFQAVKKMQEDLTLGWQEHFSDTLTKGHFSVSGFAEAFEGVFKLMKTDVEKIFSTMLTSIIDGFLQPLFQNVQNVASNISSMLIGALTGQGGGGGPMSWISGGGSTPSTSLLGGALAGLFGGGGGAVFGGIAASEAAGVAGATAAGLGVTTAGIATGGLAASGGGLASTTIGTGMIGPVGSTSTMAGGGSMLGSVVGFLATNPIGWAIDAGIGALALWNHFSGPDDKELGGRAAVTQWESDVWSGLSDAQRKEASSAGWANPKDAGAMVWMREMYTNLHRPDPEKSAEAYVANVFGSITKGPSGVVSAVQDVDSFADGGMVRGPFAGAPTMIKAHDGEVVLNSAQQKNLAASLSVDALHAQLVGLRRDLQHMMRTQPVMLRHALRGL